MMITSKVYLYRRDHKNRYRVAIASCERENKKNIYFFRKKKETNWQWREWEMTNKPNPYDLNSCLLSIPCEQRRARARSRESHCRVLNCKWTWKLHKSAKVSHRGELAHSLCAPINEPHRCVIEWRGRREKEKPSTLCFLFLCVHENRSSMSESQFYNCNCLLYAFLHTESELLN